MTASQCFGKSCIPDKTPSLLSCLITLVTSVEDSTIVAKCFPQSVLLNLGNKSKSGGLKSGLYGGWGSTFYPYFSKMLLTDRAV